MKLGLIVAVTVAGLLFGVAVQTASAISGSLRIESATAFVGETVEVDIVVNVTEEPGLGAVVVDPIWDPAVVEAIDCVAYQGGACRIAFGPAEGHLQIAWRDGLYGENILATFMFRCIDAGTTRLELDVNVFDDATMGFPAEIDAKVIDGAITCVEDGRAGTIRIDDAESIVGEQVPILLHAEDVVDPPLGAWTVNVTYDPAVATVTECFAYQRGACVIGSKSGTVRVLGAHSTGLTGDFPLALITFRCSHDDGATPLTLELEFFGIAGFVGGRLPVSADGTLTCQHAPAPTATPPPILPPTGAGAPSDPAPIWPIAALAALGLATTAIGAVAARWRA